LKRQWLSNTPACEVLRHPLPWKGKGMIMKTLRNAYNLVTPYQVLVPGYAMEMVWLFLMRE
jgi:hypothetical protein